MVTRSVDAVFGASSYLDSGLRAGRARAWSSYFSVMPLVRMLHVFALNILEFNLAILNPFSHQLIQLVETFIISLLIVGFCTFFHLVVVYHVRVRILMIFVNYHVFKGILRFLLVFRYSAR
jgi:hypothetical protein